MKKIFTVMFCIPLLLSCSLSESNKDSKSSFSLMSEETSSTSKSEEISSTLIGSSNFSISKDNSEIISNSISSENVSSSSISSLNVSSSTIVSKSEVEPSIHSSEMVHTSYEEKLAYYDSVDFTLSGKQLMVALDKLLDSTDSTSFSYSGLFSIFKYSDADPANPNSGKILSFYSGTPSSSGSMNREHTWPNSRGGFLVEDDPHVIRPTLTSENSSRGNDFYNDSKDAKWDPGTFGNYKYRGIAARIIFYAAVKAQDEGLYLVDKTDDPRTSSKNSITKKNWNPTMGKLSTLLKWNLEYPIDQTETLRNDVLYSKFNHCRNPFIDYPSLACSIWGNTNSETLSVCNGVK